MPSIAFARETRIALTSAVRVTRHPTFLVTLLAPRLPGANARTPFHSLQPHFPPPPLHCYSTHSSRLMEENSNEAAAANAEASGSSNSTSSNQQDDHTQSGPRPKLVPPEGMSVRQYKRELKRERLRIRLEEKKEKKRAEKRAAGVVEETFVPSGQGKRAKARRARERNGFHIGFDLSYEDTMLGGEVNSLVTQLRNIYGANMREEKPWSMYLTSLGGQTEVKLDTQDYKAWAVEASEEHYTVVAKKHNLTPVFLTPDSENVLEEIKPDRLYMIGGIVDRIRTKNLSRSRAGTNGVETARLPIKENLPDVHNVGTHIILSLVSAFNILREYVNCRDWERVVREVIPNRVQKHKKKGSSKEDEGENDDSTPEGATPVDQQTGSS